MAPSLPTFIVLKSSVNGKYLSCQRNHKETPGFLEFSGEEVVSPHCKFEVIEASDDENDEGLVHIRSCFNNRYLVRPEKSNQIVAQAHRKEEDQSKWCCTLFKPTIPSNGHVQLSNVSHCLCSGKSTIDRAETLTFINWETLIILPRNITFKDDEGSYLGAREFYGGNYLKFKGTGDIEDPTIGHEVFYTPDGNIRIKSNYTGKFWRRNPGSEWVLPDSDDTTNSNLDTIFSVTKLNDNIIALRNLGNNEYCKTYKAEGKTYCLNASADTIWKDVRVQIGEYVKKREISHVKFHLLDARMYNEEIVHDTTQTTINEGSSPVNKTLKFTYKTENSRTWNSSVSVNLGVSTSFSAGIPCIAEGEVTVSAEVESKCEWGVTKSESFETESNHTVVVPAMTKVMVKLQSKKATCDIPYSYRQCDTLFNETKVSYHKHDGIYTGMNTFNFECRIAEETKLTKSTVNSGSGNPKIGTHLLSTKAQEKDDNEEFRCST